MRLTSLGPIVDAHVTLGYSTSGWRLFARHRHTAGLFTDCDALTVDRLTLEELQDVILAITSTWGPLSGSRFG